MRKLTRDRVAAGAAVVVATGRNGGRAFGTSLAGANPKPTAWRRSGSSRTQVPFPGAQWSKVAGGFTHALNNPGANDAGALLEFGS
jgi:hypothetical protein